jgi:hypothetical protein
MSADTVISYPIPAYSNLPIEPFYQPGVFQISNITNGQMTTVTTSVGHDYVIGQLIRLDIPPGFGERQLNQQTGYVINIPAANQVVVTINSTNADAFQSSSNTTKPQIVAVGDINTGVTNNQGRINNGTTIPGSFINIS